MTKLTRRQVVDAAIQNLRDQMFTIASDIADHAEKVKSIEGSDDLLLCVSIEEQGVAIALRMHRIIEELHYWESELRVADSDRRTYPANV